MITATSTSEARSEANRRNARKSTGPKTEAGKANSRRNSLKHGLTATVVDLDRGLDLEVAESWPIEAPGHSEASRSRSGIGWQAWVNGQVDRAMAQIERAQRIEARLRDQAAWRALSVWEDDRDLDAEELGAKLGRDPSRMVARLRQSPQGCDWLIKRWGWLVKAAESGPEGWTEEQTSLALDLLGIPEVGRSSSSFNPTPLALARARIAELEEQRTSVEEADQVARALAETDDNDVPTPELARLRRYEQALVRRLQWLLAELRAEAPEQPAPQVEPARNEAKAADETKPTSPGSPDLTPRNRPDLARIARRDRQKHRDPSRYHPSA